jgi:hypothetical protein
MSSVGFSPRRLAWAKAHATKFVALAAQLSIIVNAMDGPKYHGASAAESPPVLGALLPR